MRAWAAAWLRLIVLVPLVLTGVLVRTQRPTALSVTDRTAQTGVQLSVAPWQFPDDDVPSWREVVSAQAAELVFVAALADLALVSFLRKSIRLKHVMLAASVLYFGFVRSLQLSVVDIFGFLTLDLPIFRYSLAWYLFVVSLVASTIVWGRLYCGRACAFGSFTQLLDRLVPAKVRVDLPQSVQRRAAYIKYAILAGTIMYFLATRDRFIYRWVEPFWMFTRRGTAGMWTALGVLLLATLFVRNMYCRFLCPVGAFLGIVSKLSLVRIKRWSECHRCKICEKACEWGAVRGSEILAAECVRCDDCERLYWDTERCPHWIIIQKKSAFTARQSAVPTGSAGF